MRHYKQIGQNIRAAIIASMDAPFMETAERYDPNIKNIPEKPLSDVAIDPSILKTEYLLKCDKGYKLRINPCSEPTVSLETRPGSDRDDWVFFDQLSPDTMLVGVNVSGIEQQRADKVLDDIIQRTRIKELDSKPDEVANYMKKRTA